MEGKPSLDDLPTAAGALGHGASIVFPRNPPPVDLAMEAKIRGFSSVGEWDDYLAREEEKLGQEKRRLLENLKRRKRQFDEKHRADCAGSSEDLDLRRRFERHLDERESRLQVENAWIAQEQSEIEKKREDDRIRLAQRVAEIQRMAEQVQRDEREFLAMQKMKQQEIEKKMEEDRIGFARREADVQRRLKEVELQECELNTQEEELNKFVAMRKEQLQKRDRCKNKFQGGQLQKPLLLQPERKNDENYGNWNLSHIVSALAFAGGFILFFRMQAVFSLDYPKFIVHAFAILWALGSVVLSFRISRRFRGKNSVSSYIAPFSSLCFTLLGLYALYLMSLWFDGTLSGVSSSSSEPTVGFGKQTSMQV